MHLINQMKLEILSIPANVAFARITVAAFASQTDCTLSDLDEIKVAVSEAVENAIIHGYAQAQDRFIEIYAALTSDSVEISVADKGKGIADINAAIQPAFSSEPERLGLGFTFMRSFMDNFKVESTIGQGTVVSMSKRVGSGAARISPEQ